MTSAPRLRHGLLEHVHPLSCSRALTKQKEALEYGIKGPIVYTSVGVKNWTAWKKLGISNINAPTMYHPSVSLTEAVSLGDLQHPQSPMTHRTAPYQSSLRSRQAAQEQHRLGRAELSPRRSKPSNAKFATSSPQSRRRRFRSRA